MTQPSRLESQIKSISIPYYEQQNAQQEDFSFSYIKSKLAGLEEWEK